MPAFRHERALVESESIGERTRIWAFAHVMEGASLGEDCNVGEHCFLEKGARVGDRVTLKNGVSVWDGLVIEDDVFVGPHAVFTNDIRPRSRVRRSGGAVGTTILQGASIGANATLLCGITIGRWAMVGAGAVVTRNVPDHALVLGVPARQRGWVCRCGESLVEPADEAYRCSCGLGLTRCERGLVSGA